MEKEHAVNKSDSPNNVSAADYDPSLDRIRDLHHSASQTDLLKTKDHQEKVSEGIDSQADMLASDYTEKLEQPAVVKESTEIDMFSDNLDMFADTDITAGQNALLTNATAASNPNLTDNWDDPEGYYSKYSVCRVPLFYYYLFSGCVLTFSFFLKKKVLVLVKSWMVDIRS